MGMWYIGIPLGAFVGVISGIIFMLILRTGFQGTGLKHVSALIGELTALATFSLGGSWFAKGILQGAASDDLLGPYILAFAATFFLLTSKNLYRATVRLGNQIGEQERVGR